MKVRGGWIELRGRSGVRGGGMGLIHHDGAKLLTKQA